MYLTLVLLLAKKLTDSLLPQTKIVLFLYKCVVILISEEKKKQYIHLSQDNMLRHNNKDEQQDYLVQLATTYNYYRLVVIVEYPF